MPASPNEASQVDIIEPATPNNISTFLPQSELQHDIEEEIPTPSFAVPMEEFAESVEELRDRVQEMEMHIEMGEEGSPATTPPVTVFPPDTSEEVPHRRSFDTLDTFTLALGLWVEGAAITRDNWESLLQVFSLLLDVNQLKALPKKLSTFHAKIKSQLPLLKLRRKELTLDSTQLPTLSRSDKAGSLICTEWMYWFDPKHLFQIMLSSRVFTEKLHFGMANFVDRPSELWESYAWGSSIRACSGDFASYPDGEPLFPSDIALFWCKEEDCKCQDTEYTPHMGRVLCVGRDYTSAAPDPGAIIVVVQQLAQRWELSEALLRLLRIPDKDPKELFLLEDIVDQLTLSQIKERLLNVHLDYKFRYTEATKDIRDFDLSVQATEFNWII
ncbi:hypothetical protein LPUS_04195 [Lasallia pustulata]|uniref:Uncharacterized protein n=1 Tax=Lasallia pustulata TaxID=136370 RepID=A0A1W5CWF3_9LECA|nr:hypothetical protein LPUS_04195 [Lasallia pustulata]